MEVCRQLIWVSEWLLFNANSINLDVFDSPLLQLKIIAKFKIAWYLVILKFVFLFSGVIAFYFSIGKYTVTISGE